MCASKGLDIEHVYPRALAKPTAGRTSADHHLKYLEYVVCNVHERCRSNAEAGSICHSIAANGTGAKQRSSVVAKIPTLCLVLVHTSPQFLAVRTACVRAGDVLGIYPELDEMNGCLKAVGR